MRITKKEYEEFLNEVGESLSEENFIIGGEMRRMKYGSALRKYDPTAFEVGFNDYYRRKTYAEYIKSKRK
jgi:hypothetical protein